MGSWGTYVIVAVEVASVYEPAELIFGAVMVDEYWREWDVVRAMEKAELSKPSACKIGLGVD